MSLVIHPHFHRRYTGITRHVENVVPELARELETRAIGSHLGPALPRIRWGAITDGPSCATACRR